MTYKEKQFLERIREEYGEGMLLYTIESYYKLRDEEPDPFTERCPKARIYSKQAEVHDNTVGK